MKRAIAKGATSQSIDIVVYDSSSTTGGKLTGLAFDTANLTAYYRRPGAAAVAITLATLAAITTAWTSGGFKEVDATNMPGHYRLDLPDAVVATGADSATLCLRGATNMVSVDIEIQLTALNLQDAVRGGMTALPNAAFGAAGGLYSKILRASTLQAGGTTSATLDAGASATTNAYNYTILQITGGTGSGQQRVITAYNGTTKVATVHQAWVTTPDNTSTFEIVPFGIEPATTASVAAETWAYLQANSVSKIDNLATSLSALAVTLAELAATLGTPAGVSLAADAAAIKAAADAILVDTNELQIDWVNGGRLDLILDARASQATVDIILVDTNELQVDWANGGRLDLILDASASQASVDAVDDLLDTEMPALTAAVAAVYARLGAPVGASTAADIAAVFAALPRQFRKNTAFPNFTFRMVSSTDHVTGAPNLTITAKRRLDNGAFAACANAVQEIAFGWYTINFAAADLNGDFVSFEFKAAGADDNCFGFPCQP
ncbi:MAG: hypothetical protein A3E01_09950 [Gammaproteobacteria bacterium RIFCSPHIGHO2_12_FULL_63_22]|nr:MAG: hypothetical protein A3E01_09950 [Gammaproteobacteria bacterium RIFCSPHIGHO2_12_FULL_63_22]